MGLALVASLPCCSSRHAQVNPLAETDTELVAADAKLGFDDNASFRQQDLFGMRDESQEDSRCVIWLPCPRSLGCFAGWSRLQGSKVALAACYER